MSTVSNSNPANPVPVSAIDSALAGRGRVRASVTGQQVTTFGLGGPIATLVEPGSLDSLVAVVTLLKDSGSPFRVLGAGSNLLIADSGVADPVMTLGKPFAGWIPGDSSRSFEAAVRELLSGTAPALLSQADLKSSYLEYPAQTEVTIIAGGSTSLMSLSRLTAGVGAAGLEFAAGIPASLGGAVYMNAGAHGGSIGDVVGKIALVTPGAEFLILDRSDLPFTYRHSGIPAGSIVVAAELRCKIDSPSDIQSKRMACLDYRKKTQPLHLPSAGSVFRNPSGAAGDTVPAAAQLLDQLGFRGRTRGGVQFSQMHANWLVKPGADEPAAQTEDARGLIAEAKEEVLREFGVKLVTEIVFW